MPAALGPVSAASASTTPVVPAGPRWPRSTFTRAWRCASCDTPRASAITIEIYTQVPDKATQVALKRLSDAVGAAVPALTCPAMTSRPPLLYAAAVHVAHTFGSPVELRGLEPLAFWMQTRRSSS